MLSRTTNKTVIAAIRGRKKYEAEVHLSIEDVKNFLDFNRETIRITSFEGKDAKPTPLEVKPRKIKCIMYNSTDPNESWSYLDF